MHENSAICVWIITRILSITIFFSCFAVFDFFVSLAIIISRFGICCLEEGDQINLVCVLQLLACFTVLKQLNGPYKFISHFGDLFYSLIDIEDLGAGCSSNSPSITSSTSFWWRDCSLKPNGLRLLFSRGTLLPKLTKLLKLWLLATDCIKYIPAMVRNGGINKKVQ